MIVKKGKKRAKIELGGLTIKEIVFILNKKEKEERLNLAQDYKSIKSVEEAEDKKGIVFNFSSGKRVKFNLPDYKLYCLQNNKPLTISQLTSIKIQNRVESLAESTVVPWIKSFISIIGRNLDNVEDLFLVLGDKNKKEFEATEQLSKEPFIQKLDNKKFECLKLILNNGESNYSYKDSSCLWFEEFDLKKFRKENYWFIENSMCNLQGGYNLIEFYSIYKIFKKERLTEVFEYSFNQYQFPFGVDDEDVLADVFINLVKLGYDPIRLVDYICRDMPNQGIHWCDDDGITILSDYVDMNVKMKREYEKYPRYLKTYHDVASKNYEIAKNAQFKKRFARQVKNFKKYEYSNSLYSIISPKSTNDLVEEGTKLCHCVASYAEDVANKETVIMFMRKNDALNIPLVTIEINKNKLVQAKGKSNGRPQPEEAKFLQEYKEYLLKIKNE